MADVFYWKGCGRLYQRKVVFVETGSHSLGVIANPKDNRSLQIRITSLQMYSQPFMLASFRPNVDNE